MSIIGTFNPALETYPSGSVTGSSNLIPNSSQEISLTATAFEDVDIVWSTDVSHSGNRSVKVTVDHSNSGTDALVRFPLPADIVAPGTNTYNASAWIYIPSGSPLIGTALIGMGYYDTYGSGGSGHSTSSTPLVAGWQRRTVVIPFSGTADITGIQVGRFSSGLPNGAVFYVDDVMLSLGTPPLNWEPADGEPFFTQGQSWSVTGAGTFQGFGLNPGDIITCTNDVGEFQTYDNSTWEVTILVDTVEEALVLKPAASHGFPIGLGDWRLAVEMLLPTDSTSRWGVGKWGESVWGALGWQDVSPWVRGIEWSRGTAEFGQRPEVGVASITLDNADRQFSPWNGVSAFQGATVVDSATNAVQPGYLAPGTVMRVVAHSPLGMVEPVSTGPLVTTTVYEDNFDTYNTSYWYSYSAAPVASGGKLTISGTGNNMDTQNYQLAYKNMEHIIKVDSFDDFSGTPRVTIQVSYEAGVVVHFDESGINAYVFTDDAVIEEYPAWTFVPGQLIRVRELNDVLSLAYSNDDGTTWVEVSDVSTADLTYIGDEYNPWFVTNGGEVVLDSYVYNTLIGSAPTLAPSSLNSWVPQFTGVVESWVDDTAGLGAESFVTVTLVEPLAQMAKVDANALLSAVGNDDTTPERLQRLLDAAGWIYGDVDDTYWSNVLSPGNPTPLLQSTDMAGNRISEMYLTVDSTGDVVRSDRAGYPIVYPFPDGGDALGTRIQRGPEANWWNGLSYRYETGSPPEYYSTEYVGDSLRVVNDDEIIENTLQLARVGGSERSGSDLVSVNQYGKRTYSRNDLIVKTDPIIDYMIEKRLEKRARKPLRLESVSLHSGHQAGLIPIIGLDIDSYIYVQLPPLPTHTVAVSSAFISGYTHRVTPLNDAEITWTCDITFGIQGNLVNEPI